MNPATFLRVLGPEPWNVAYAEPSIRPDDSRYGDNPNRVQRHTQFQARCECVWASPPSNPVRCTPAMLLTLTHFSQRSSTPNNQPLPLLLPCPAPRRPRLPLVPPPHAAPPPTQVILKPDPGNPQELYLGSLEALGIDTRAHDVRFVEDNWESPVLGAWGLGWEVSAWGGGRVVEMGWRQGGGGWAVRRGGRGGGRARRGLSWEGQRGGGGQARGGPAGEWREGGASVRGGLRALARRIR